jgi:hypothetical protein
VEAKKPRSLLAEGPKAPSVAVIDCPVCPEDREDCRFIFGAKNLSSMHSPLVYNRQGEPVAGGANIHTRVIHCNSCSKWWTARQTQLEEAQGKPAKWELSRT